MSFDIAAWKDAYQSAVTEAFGERIVCAGLHGSRARNEARVDSDIDTVLILDQLTGDDLSAYRRLIQSLPEIALVCGFVSGRNELLHWDAGELVSFYFDTEPLIGNLDFVRPAVTPQAARRAVHTGACGIYHACCHSSVFGDESTNLTDLYKAAFFVLRAKHYSKTGTFIKRGADLLPLLSPYDQAILQTHLAAKPQDFDSAGTFNGAEALRAWSGNLIAEFGVFPVNPS